MLDRYCRLRLLEGVIDRGSKMLPGLEGLARAALVRSERNPPRMRRAGMVCALRMRRYNNLLHAARSCHEALSYGQKLVLQKHPSWSRGKQANAKLVFLDMIILARRELDSIDRLMPKISLYG